MEDRIDVYKTFSHEEKLAFQGYPLDYPLFCNTIIGVGDIDPVALAEDTDKQFNSKNICQVQGYKHTVKKEKEFASKVKSDNDSDDDDDDDSDSDSSVQCNQSPYYKF